MSSADTFRQPSGLTMYTAAQDDGARHCQRHQQRAIRARRTVDRAAAVRVAMRGVVDRSTTQLGRFVVAQVGTIALVFAPKSHKKTDHASSARPEQTNLVQNARRIGRAAADGKLVSAQSRALAIDVIERRTLSACVRL